VSTVPNQAAIDRLIWMPGLDDGWDPQGLTLAGNSVFVSAYRSRGAWQFRGPCRVFRVDSESGREMGHVDVPRPCGHAGGLAYAGGKLFVADTHSLFEFDLDRAFDQSTASPRMFRLGRGLKGAFSVSGKDSVWIGDYQEAGPAAISKFRLAAIASLEDGSTLTAGMASAIVPIPTYGQGGAFDETGALWVARSDIGWGFLDKLEGGEGRFKARYQMPGGIEGIAFDQHGRLWCVSEAGARHLPWHYPFFPLIFRLNPARLAPAE
jgi:sugar lactone lactonase YvrE